MLWAREEWEVGVLGGTLLKRKGRPQYGGDTATQTKIWEDNKRAKARSGEKSREMLGIVYEMGRE